MKATATINQITNDEVAQVDVITQLFAERVASPVKEYEIGGAKIDLDALDALPKDSTPGKVTFYYRCKQPPKKSNLPPKEDDQAKKHTQAEAKLEKYGTE